LKKKKGSLIKRKQLRSEEKLQRRSHTNLGIRSARAAPTLKGGGIRRKRRKNKKEKKGGRLRSVKEPTSRTRPKRGREGRLRKLFLPTARPTARKKAKKKATLRPKRRNLKIPHQEEETGKREKLLEETDGLLPLLQMGKELLSALYAPSLLKKENWAVKGGKSLYGRKIFEGVRILKSSSSCKKRGKASLFKKVLPTSKRKKCR